jgi:hypothetical protein
MFRYFGWMIAVRRGMVEQSRRVLFHPSTELVLTTLELGRRRIRVIACVKTHELTDDPLLLRGVRFAKRRR